MGTEEYISEIDGKFSVDRIFNDKRYNFGVFNTYEEALEKLDYLEEEGWPISTDVIEKTAVVDNLGLSMNNIEKNEDKFIIFKFIDGEKVIFGEYDSIEDAKRIRTNLIDNAWESTEPYTRSKYGKYILRENVSKKFVVRRTYKGVSHTFGYFKTLDEAIKCREDLVSTNWGDLNIPIQMRPGKYIAYNGMMYTVQKMIKGKLNVFGFFYELDDAIKQRDWLVHNGWSKLEVPDDSKRHIHKKGDKYLIYKRFDDDIEYFGTYSSLDEAKRQRNKLIENDWVIEGSSDKKEITNNVYFDEEFYTIEKIVEGQNRIYGVYKNKNQAISDEKKLIESNWDGQFAISTEEYPYGENIVPFDYIFILEDNKNGLKEEIGRYYSFKDVIKARNKIFEKTDDGENKLVFSVKIGKSHKNRGWSIIRDTTYDLIPKLPYEDDCDIIVDGIPTTGKLNLLPRIFYTKTGEIINHLKNLAETNPEGRIDVQLLLNKDNLDNYASNDAEKLNKENFELKQDITELKYILDYMDEENNNYLDKFAELNKIMENYDKIDVNELNSVMDGNLRIKIFDMINQMNSINDLLKK